MTISNSRIIIPWFRYILYTMYKLHMSESKRLMIILNHTLNHRLCKTIIYTKDFDKKKNLSVWIWIRLKPNHFCTVNNSKMLLSLAWFKQYNIFV